MAVVLASTAFWAAVTYRFVGEDGSPQAFHFRARYKRLKTSERKSIDRRIRANRITPDVRVEMEKRLDAPDARFTAAERAEIEADMAAKPITDAEFLDAVLMDWDLKDQDGQPVPYTTATREAVCEDYDGLEAALVVGCTDARVAALKPEEISKNSVAPSGTGS